MNFGKQIKDEIITKPAKERHCKKAFLAGLVRGSGALYEKDGALGLEFKVSEESVAEIAGDYLKSVCGYDVREVGFSEDKLNKKDVFYIDVIGDGSLDTLEALGIIDRTPEGVNVSYDMFKVCENRECCKKAFLRGLFVSCGSCTVPDGENAASGYHLEMSFSHSTTALAVSKAIAAFGVSGRIIRRKENFVLYLKSAEEIKDFIAMLPAPVSVLKLTDIMIERELSNNSNRQTNCDIGNVNKQVEASAKQTEAIKKISEKQGLSSLKKELYDTATARIKYPDDTLSELAERLNVSKSCLNHRLRKLVCIANEV